MGGGFIVAVCTLHVVAPCIREALQEEEPPQLLPEYNGAVAVEDDAVLYVPAYGTRQYLRFGVAA